MRKCHCSLQTIDPYLVTGYGEDGSIQDKSFVLVHEDDRLISFPFSNVELVFIFGPKTPEGVIVGHANILREAGFELPRPVLIAFANNKLMRDFINSRSVAEKLLFVRDIPVFRLGQNDIGVGPPSSTSTMQ